MQTLTLFLMISVSPIIEPYGNTLCEFKFKTLPFKIRKTSSDFVFSLINKEPALNF